MRKKNSPSHVLSKTVSKQLSKNRDGDSTRTAVCVVLKLKAQVAAPHTADRGTQLLELVLKEKIKQIQD